jgi:hypothetical protein
VIKKRRACTSRPNFLRSGKKHLALDPDKAEQLWALSEELISAASRRAYRDLQSLTGIDARRERFARMSD